MVQVACLDVWAPAVRAAVQAAAPQGWTLSFADSYEPAHQQALAARAQVLVPGFATVDEALLAAAPGVCVVHKWGIGLDAIDQQALRRRGIALAITAGGNAGPVAELAIGLMLAAVVAMGVHSTFFGPIKYSILPQHLHPDEVLAGTGLVEAGTYIAILAGTIVAGWIEVEWAALAVLATAIVGYFTSL